MAKSIFSKISPSIFTKEAKTPHSATLDEQRLMEICKLSHQETITKLNSRDNGITSEDAETRLEEYGRNELAHTKKIGILQDIFNRCKSPLVIQLLIIAIISGLMDDVKSAIVVGTMVLLSVGLSFILDRKSSSAVEALGKRVQSHTVALRDGKEVEIPISDVVPGDIIFLQAGSIIPADIRLLIVKDFFVSQSVLTGESLPIEKNQNRSSLAMDLFLNFQMLVFKEATY